MNLWTPDHQMKEIGKNNPIYRVHKTQQQRCDQPMSEEIQKENGVISSVSENEVQRS